MGATRSSVVPPTIRSQIVQQLARMRKHYLDLSMWSLLKIKKFKSYQFNKGVEYILSKYLLLLNVFFRDFNSFYQCVCFIVIAVIAVFLNNVILSFHFKASF